MSETLLDIFAMQVARSARRPALRYRSGGLWRSRTWEEWAATAEEIAAALACCAVSVGDRVAILAQTRLAWVEADIGILHAGAATVPIYPTLLPDAIGQILRDSGARVVFVDDPTQLRKLFDPRCGPLPALEHAVVFDRDSRLARPDETGRRDVTLDDVRPEAGALKVDTLERMLGVGRETLAKRPELLRERRRQITASS
ncbi:partial Surfactin synthase subunit 2, partial [Anaerolineae bacterium]